MNTLRIASFQRVKAMTQAPLSREELDRLKALALHGRAELIGRSAEDDDFVSPLLPKLIAAARIEREGWNGRVIVCPSCGWSPQGHIIDNTGDCLPECWCNPANYPPPQQDGKEEDGTDNRNSDRVSDSGGDSAVAVEGLSGVSLTARQRAENLAKAFVEHDIPLGPLAKFAPHPEQEGER